MGEQFKLVVDHAPIMGVTAEMLDWYWDNMGPLETNYKPWHPQHHIAFEWLVSPKEHGHNKGVAILWEYVGEDLYPMRIGYDDPATVERSTDYDHFNGSSFYDYAGKQAIGKVIHEYKNIPGGIQLRSTFYIPAYFGQKFVDDLRQHNVEEMSHLPSFLPRICTEQVGK